MKPAAVALLFAFAAPAFAQDKRDDPFKDSAYGHRVEIMLKSGFGILGKLIPSPYPQDAQELSKSRTIFIDMSLEYPELGGRKDELSGKFLPSLFGFDRGLVKSVRRLQDLSPEEVATREKQREDSLARLLVEEANRRKAEAEADAARRKDLEDSIRRKRAEEAKTTEGQLRQAAERLEKARGVYDKFPPPAWGPERLTAIQKKHVTKVPLTADEKEFISSIEDWLFWKAQLDEKEQPTPTPAPSPTPAPTETPK